MLNARLHFHIATQTRGVRCLTFIPLHNNPINPFQLLAVWKRALTNTNGNSPRFRKYREAHLPLGPRNPKINCATWEKLWGWVGQKCKWGCLIGALIFNRILPLEIYSHRKHRTRTSILVGWVNRPHHAGSNNCDWIPQFFFQVVGGTKQQLLRTCAL